MFTVLLKNKKTGDQHLHQCERVRFVWTTTDSEDCDPGLLMEYGDGSSSHVGMVKDQNEPFRLDAFVMNASGQTVARYAL